MSGAIKNHRHIAVHIKTLSGESLAYNPSVTRHNGRLLMFYRKQISLESFYSKIFSVELKENFEPIEKTNKEVKINIDHPKADNLSFEDPRAFIFEKKLFLSFSVRSINFKNFTAISSLNDNLDASSTYIPRFGKNYKNVAASSDIRPLQIDFPKVVKTWEKNWQFFENQKKLYFSYKINPHVVVCWDLSSKKIIKKYKSFIAPECWRYGDLRGGTPPIKFGNEYFSFFHSVIEEKKLKRYLIGAYSFSADPPFSIRRISKSPIYYAEKSEIIGQKRKSVVFPCGAFLKDGLWNISYGENDRAIKILRLNHEWLLENMAETSSLFLSSRIKYFLNLVEKKLILIFFTFINSVPRNIDRNSIFFKIDKGVGRVGIFIKRKSPATYDFLKRNLSANLSKKIFYLGWLGHGNLGDEISFTAFKKLFANAGMRCYKLKNIGKIPAKANVFLGGGTLVGEPSFLKNMSLLLEKEAALFIFGTGARSEIYFDVRKYSCAHFSEMSKWQEAIKNSPAIFLRGEESAKILNLPKLKIISDIALSACKSSLKIPRKRIVGINIGCHTIEYGNQQKINIEIVKTIEYLLKNNFQIEFIPMHKIDFDIMNELNKKYNLGVRIWKRYLNPKKTVKRFLKYYMVIGQRFHSCVISSGCGVPSLPLVYSSKYSEFLSQMSLTKYAIQTDKISSEALIGKIEEITANYTEIKKSLISLSNHYKDLQKSAAKEIVSIIKYGK